MYVKQENEPQCPITEEQAQAFVKWVMHWRYYTDEPPASGKIAWLRAAVREQKRHDDHVAQREYSNWFEANGPGR